MMMIAMLGSCLQLSFVEYMFDSWLNISRFIYDQEYQTYLNKTNSLVQSPSSSRNIVASVLTSRFELLQRIICSKFVIGRLERKSFVRLVVSLAKIYLVYLVAIIN